MHPHRRRIAAARGNDLGDCRAALDPVAIENFEPVAFESRLDAPAGSLCCYRTHAEVAELIADEFAVTLTPRHVRAYDPMSFQFAGSRRWSDYHQLVRKRCVQEVGEVAIAHRAYLIRQLQQIFDTAMDRGDYGQALKALEQAAKEMGNRYVKS